MSHGNKTETHKQGLTHLLDGYLVPATALVLLLLRAPTRDAGGA